MIIATVIVLYILTCVLLNSAATKFKSGWKSSAGWSKVMKKKPCPDDWNLTASISQTLPKARPQKTLSYCNLTVADTEKLKARMRRFRNKQLSWKSKKGNR